MNENSSFARLRQHWLLLALLFSSGAAFLWPSSALDPFRLSLSGLRALVVATMFCLGLVVQVEELSELRKHPFAVLLGVAVQCTLMPLLAWLAIFFLGLEGPLAQGVMLVGCVPGAMASNVLTMTARGNVSYSVSLTSVATLLSPITVPVALSVVGGIVSTQAALSPGQQAKLLLLTVVLPVLAGFAAKQMLGVGDAAIRKFAPLVASFALLWIIASVVAGNRERLGQIQATMLVALLSINLLGYAGGFLAGRAGRLPSAMTRALSLEVGMQNAGLGTFLASSLFGEGSFALVPTATYTFGCMLTGTVLASMWAGWGANRPASERME